MPESEKELTEIVRRGVRRRVGLHALRHIGAMVDRWNDEERAQARLAIWLVVVFAIAALVAAGWLLFR